MLDITGVFILTAEYYIVSTCFPLWIAKMMPLMSRVIRNVRNGTVFILERLRRCHLTVVIRQKLIWIVLFAWQTLRHVSLYIWPAHVYIVHHNLNEAYEKLVNNYRSCFPWRIFVLEVINDMESIKENWPIIVARSQRSRFQTDMDEALKGLKECKRKRTIYMLCRNNDGHDDMSLGMDANPDLLGQIVVPTPDFGVDKNCLKKLLNMLKSFYTPKRIGEWIW